METTKVAGRDIAHHVSAAFVLLGPILLIALAVTAGLHESGEAVLSPFTVGWFATISLAAAVVFYFTRSGELGDAHADQ
ncbi:hypothetical protein FM104_04875 [Microbacterium esteraromaticum]|uniref:Uncharacterized protein n=1 Tax=Microbacterium esteraromaticum TaxID=57043 RepID=A0A1R4J0Y8_9MICO|nr:hypothetical protein [Microbacterium esteraromaticum]SJN25385.1 hypothetical protein FM104_04875 [Microbacterium esteraromaticum]